MNKREIIDSFENGHKIDVAVPLDWANEAKELGVDPDDYAWDYRDSIHGKPISLVKQHNKLLTKKPDNPISPSLKRMRFFTEAHHVTLDGLIIKSIDQEIELDVTAERFAEICKAENRYHFHFITSDKALTITTIGMGLRTTQKD